MGKNDTRRSRDEYGKLRPSEKVLGIIALLMLLGWTLRWMGYGPKAEPTTDFPWFVTFSVPSAILVLVLILLKLNVIELLPGKLQEKILPWISLFPVLGFLIAELSSFQSFLTVGGAMALAYISATSYWRNYIPDFVTDPLGAGSRPAARTAPAQTAAAPAPQKEAASGTPAPPAEPPSPEAAAEEPPAAPPSNAPSSDAPPDDATRKS